eukprot:6332-Heterococcus_DN1.PRE.2
MPESSKCERNAEQHADVQLVKWRLRRSASAALRRSASAASRMHTMRSPLCCKHVLYRGRFHSKD